MFKFIITALTVTFCFSAPAYAQVVVNGGGAAKDCYDKTKRNDPGRKSTLNICKKALLDFSLTPDNKAATHINTAILYMRSGNYVEANGHYQKAITLRPKISEAYISLAANYIYQGEFEAAIKAVNIGIDLGTEKMPEALYNRAIAYDNLENYSAAYKDLKQVLALRPDWDAAIRAIDNYEVTAAPG